MVPKFMSKKTRHQHHAVAATALAMIAGQYGQPAQRATVSQARTLPPALELAKQAAGDADNWWAAQGSRPPALEMTAGPSFDGSHMGYGYLRSGHMNIDPKFLQSINGVLQSPKTSRHGRIAALVGLWHIVAHERGHNIGYDHQSSGLMAGDMGAVPGQAYKWAASVLGPPAKKRRAAL